MDAVYRWVCISVWGIWTFVERFYGITKAVETRGAGWLGTVRRVDR
jgi:hypothetical protein